MLLESGVNGETFYNQVKADVAWLRVVREVLSRDINISESEVELVLDRLKENQGKPEYLLAEILSCLYLIEFISFWDILNLDKFILLESF